MIRIDNIKKLNNVVLYILQSFNGLERDMLYAIMYLSQKDYLTDVMLTIIPDRFMAFNCGPVPLYTNSIIENIIYGDNSTELLDIASDEFIKSIYIEYTTGSKRMLYNSKNANEDYIAVMEKKYLDKWINVCRDVKEEFLTPLIKDRAWNDAWNLRQDDPEMGLITDIAMARANGASDDQIDYIRERIITNYQLGNIYQIGSYIF